jgi:hypothetical protein
LPEPNADRHGNSYRYCKCHAYSDGNGNGYGKCHAYGYADRNCDRNAAAYPDAAAASDAAPEAITVTRPIKAGTREKNSRVPRYQMDWLLRKSTLG